MEETMDRSPLSSLDQLLREWGMTPHNWKEDDNFDVLRILGLATREIYHSRVIAYLLDPKNQHGLGSEFLVRVLKKAELKQRNSKQPVIDWGIPNDITEVDIFLEKSLDKYGRVDILVRCFGKTFLIENKVYAAESVDQVKQYRDWLENSGTKGEIIFLTPKGRECSDGKAIRMSYSDLAECLSECLFNEQINPFALL